ncbi:MAG: hypothetical protein HYT86_00870 [candidate division NC10 bacterium]|nr:hypothetical protein [candidate division NC10 bacterium]
MSTRSLAALVRLPAVLGRSDMSLRDHLSTSIVAISLAAFLTAAPALAATDEARQAYREAVQAVMQQDKSISEQDRASLDQQKANLGLSDDEAQEIEQQVRVQ